MAVKGSTGPGPLMEGIVRAFIAAKLSTIPHDHKGRTEATTAWLDEVEQELAPFVGPLVESILGGLPEDHPMRPIMAEVMNPEHQVGFLLQLLFLIPAAFALVTRGAEVYAQPFINGLWAGDPNIPLSPAVLADMVERNIIDQGTGERVATQSGMAPADFDLLVQDTGEPYGVVDALRLWRQGRIGDDELSLVVYYSRVRNQFLPDLKLLAYDTMSPADAVEAALKLVLSHDQALAAFERGGGLASEFDTLLSAAGNPPGVEATLNLWNHGLVDEGQVDTVIAHSRINPQFTPIVKLLRNHWLSVYQIEQAMKAGAVDAATAKAWITAEGYPADQAEAFTVGITSGKVTTHKQVSEAQITELYETGFISEDQATSALQNLGYSSPEIPMVLELSVAARQKTILNAGISKVRTAYLAKRLSDTDAENDLNRLQVPSDAIGLYLKSWAIERDTEIRLLTAAQIGALAKKGFITTDEAVGRWVDMGYVQADAELLLANYTDTAPPGSPAAVQAANTPTAPVG